MYDELYKAWKLEIENIELERLPSDFYSRIAEYMRKLKEEGRMLDKRALKTNLLNKEMQNARRMVIELIQTRYRKIARKTARSEKISQDLLTPEEKTIYSQVSPFAEAVQALTKEIVRGHAPNVKIETEHHRTAVRFLKDVPAIIGADMKTYGPFKIEDVASLPAENIKIMIKQGLVEKVEAE